jgi:hypothetical protein
MAFFLIACGNSDWHNNSISLRISIRLAAGNIRFFSCQVVVAGRQYLVFIEDLAAVPRGALGRVVGSAEADRYAIVGALDLLFTGI